MFEDVAAARRIAEDAYTLATQARNLANSAISASADDYVRGLVRANVAALATFTVAGDDGITYVANDRVLLIGQTVQSQNGIYVVGTVGGGTAPLTRALDAAAGMILPAGFVVGVSDGNVGSNTYWSLLTGTIASSNGVWGAPLTQLVVGTNALIWAPIDATPGLALSNMSTSRAVRAVTNSLQGGAYNASVGGLLETITAFAGVTGGTSFDGLVLRPLDRVLIFGQATAANGIWEVGPITANTATLSRPADWLTGLIIPAGTLIQVSEGFNGQGTVFAVATAATVAAGVWTPVPYVVGTAAGVTGINPYSAPQIGNISQTAPTGGSLIATIHNVRGVLTANLANIATTATLATLNAASTDLTFAAGDRVLLVNQTTLSQNGIYIVGPTGQVPILTRANDWALGQNIAPGTVIRVSEGSATAATTNRNSQWSVLTTGAIVVGTTNVLFGSGGQSGFGNTTNAGLSRGYIQGAATTNAQGVGGDIVCIIWATSRFSGLFRWSFAATQVAAAATEVVTWNVQALFSAAAAAGAVTVTAGGAGNSQSFFANGAASTGITAPTNLGSTQTLYNSTETIGTLGVGSKFAAGGMFGLGNAAVVEVPFVLGANVAIQLTITNSATDRAVGNINGFLEEVINLS